ncbi:MAG: FkbM family methyltransferase [Rhodospirillales bacterium]|jgi:FkbM family methyltransferase|nr:FkbM family methyltransferase [Rhodospirillales bacterium]
MFRTQENDISLRKAVNDLIMALSKSGADEISEKITDIWGQFFVNNEACQSDTDILSVLVPILNTYKIDLLEIAAKELVRLRINYELPEGDTHFLPFISNAQYQIEHLETCYDHIKSWDIAVDIGAHVGFWTNNISSRFALVHSFEPNPVTFKCLEKNKCRNVRAYNYGLGISESTQFMVQMGTGQPVGQPTNSGSWEIHDDAEEGVYSINIRSLDSFNLKPDFIKIDVQGYEMNVLEGGIETIKEHKPVLCVECVYDGTLHHEIIQFATEELGMEIKAQIYKEYIFGWPD